MRTKYTIEFLAPIVKECSCVMDVLRKLDMRITGTSHSYLKKVIKELDIDTTHFTGSAGASAGEKHCGGPDKLHWSKILVIRKSKSREKVFRLRRALLEYGRPYRCEGEGCVIEEIWLERPLLLNIDHRNGKFWDNSPENLRFLCPNCHSQTEGHSNNKGNTHRTGTKKRTGGVTVAAPA